MLEGFHSSEVFNETKINPSRRWLRILIALSLTLVLVGANQPPTAQSASDNPDKVGFELKVYPEAPLPICIKDTVRFYVGLSRSVRKKINGKEWNLPRGLISGVAIRGSVTNPSIGALTPPESSGGYDVSDLLLADADFMFTARKAGKTTLQFVGEVRSYWDGSGRTQTLSRPYPVHVEVPVKVIPCKFKVNTTGQWIRVLDGAGASAMAVIEGAEIKADEQGHFAVSARVDWGSTYYVDECATTTSIPTSQANLTGDIDEDGQLTMNLTFEPTEWLGSLSCPYVGGGSSTTSVTLDALSLSSPASGGVFTQSQRLVTQDDMMPGSIIVVVIPEEDEGVAFQGSDQVMQVDYAVQLAEMSRDIFPGFFSDLLTYTPNH